MDFQTLRDFDLNGKTVLLRADLNVPAQDGVVRDSTRIDRLKPTIDYLRAQGAKTLILSHFGRPEGGARNPDMSLVFLTSVLQERLDIPSVAFAQDCIGGPAEALAASLQPGDVGLLENVRYHQGEKKNDPDFARQLAALGDIFVHDAFSAAHRAHASTEGLAHLLPSCAGMLMEEELNALSRALEAPEKPVMALVGGSKISTKLAVLNNLVKKVDYLVLGGGMANTFLMAHGATIGNSLCEADMAKEAQEIWATALENGCQIILPLDCVTVTQIAENADHEIFNAQSIPDGMMAIDVGIQSIDNIKTKLDSCKTIVWNGPLGVFEVKPFDNGTNAIAQYVAERTKSGDIVSIAGGGDTVAALENAGSVNDFTYVSSAGGAFLEWLEGKTLPGIAALTASKKAA